MAALRIRARGTGSIACVRSLREGVLVRTSRARTALTYVVPDAMEEVLRICEALPEPIEIRPIRTGTMTSTDMDLEIANPSIHLVIGRRRARGFLIFFAAEFGSNYDILLTIFRGDPEVVSRIEEAVRGYTCSELAEVPPSWF